MAALGLAKVTTLRAAHGCFIHCNYSMFSLLHNSNILVFTGMTLYNCFITMIGVRGRSMFPFCSLEGHNNKEHGGSGF